MNIKVKINIKQEKSFGTSYHFETKRLTIVKKSNKSELSDIKNSMTG